MLSWALTFFLIALIAGVFGFTGIAGAAAGIAQILFYLFLALLIISLLVNAFRGDRLACNRLFPQPPLFSSLLSSAIRMNIKTLAEPMRVADQKGRYINFDKRWFSLIVFPKVKEKVEYNE